MVQWTPFWRKMLKNSEQRKTTLPLQVGVGDARMANGDLRTGLERIRRAFLVSGGAGLTDGELLGRFVVARDEAAFEALVHRHGPMVLGLCRRVLGNAHDAEDAFQATFLILARKAASVVKRESVGCWLFGVAQRTAREARTVLARRRARERQMAEIPHPEVSPAEPDDWRPILDREVARLPQKYQEAVVLFYLEGWPLREAALKLGVPLGTLSNRLVKARRLLAKRLARSGLSLSFAALVSVLSEGMAAAVPAPLVVETVRAAALVAAGQLAAGTTPAALLSKGVLKTMLMTKLKLMVGMLLVVAVLGATGVAYRAGAQAPPTDKPRVEKPRSELEALRKENELLKLNLEVVLEKVRAQEAELRALRAAAADEKERNQAAERRNELLRSRGVLRLQALEGLRDPKVLDRFKAEELRLYEEAKKKAPASEAVKLVEDALKTLRAAKNAEEQQRAAKALEQAMRKLMQQIQPGEEDPKRKR
jgi:RNA polymerase sigma factor (sigma-70 family)